MIAERKRLYETLHPETQAGAVRAAAMNRSIGRDVAANLSPTFTTATARAAGKSERTIQRAAHRGEALGADALRVAGTSAPR